MKQIKNLIGNLNIKKEADVVCEGNCDPKYIYDEVVHFGIPLDYLTESHKSNCTGVLKVKAKIHKDDIAVKLARNGFMARDIEFVFSPKLDDSRPAIQLVKKFASSVGINGKSLDRGNCLVLAGSTNTGKSIGAIYACAFHRMGQYLYSGDISDKLRHDTGFRKECETSSFMILDDYSGAEGDLSYNRFIDSMFHKRHGASLPMIITTNMSLEDFKHSLPERVASRMSSERGGWSCFAELQS